jgi:hypothetical protein
MREKRTVMARNIRKSIADGRADKAKMHQSGTRPFSAQFLEIADQVKDRVSIGELNSRLGDRAFGGLLICLAIPNLAPLPPGSSTLLAAPLIFAALQLAIGRGSIWLPKTLGERSISRQALGHFVSFSVPLIKRAEQLIRPRYSAFLNDRVIGAICLVLAIVLFLPIPFGNLLPALAICVFGLSLLHRDGLAALIGLAITILSLVIVVLVSGTIILSVNAAIQWLGFGG